jgi:hypothetical protein
MLYILQRGWHIACIQYPSWRIVEISDSPNKDCESSMMRMQKFLAVATASLSLAWPSLVLAADPTSPGPPMIVPQEGNNGDLKRDLHGVPDNVKNLIVTFDQTRDKYLQQQRLLLVKLHNGATPDEQSQVRQQLQANRQEFLTELKGFREELRTDLQALKGKVSHAEFGRIIDAAHNAAGEGGHRHRGQ